MNPSKLKKLAPKILIALKESEELFIYTVPPYVKDNKKVSGLYIKVNNKELLVRTAETKCSYFS